MDPTQNAQSSAQGASAAEGQGMGDIGAEQLFATPGISTGDAVYDMIMGQIEPELTSPEINGLVEKYKDETPEQAEVRKNRYNAAYTEYEKKLQEYLTQKQGEAAVRKRKAMASVEKEARQGEHAELSNLESSISQI